MKCVGCCSSGLLPAEIINPCCNIMDNIISNQLQWHGDNLEFGQEEVISLARGSPYCKGGFLSVNIKTYLSVSHTYKSLSVCCCTEMYFRLSGGWNWLFQSEATLEETFFFTLAGTSSNLISGWFKYLQKSASDKIWHKHLIQLFIRSTINENTWTGVMIVKGLTCEIITIVKFCSHRGFGRSLDG